MSGLQPFNLSGLQRFGYVGPSDLWIPGGRVREVVVELCGKMFEAWVGGALVFGSSS